MVYLLLVAFPCFVLIWVKTRQNVKIQKQSHYDWPIWFMNVDWINDIDVLTKWKHKLKTRQLINNVSIMRMIFSCFSSDNKIVNFKYLIHEFVLFYFNLNVYAIPFATHVTYWVLGTNKVKQMFRIINIKYVHHDFSRFMYDIFCQCNVLVPKTPWNSSKIKERKQWMDALSSTSSLKARKDKNKNKGVDK